MGSALLFLDISGGEFLIIMLVAFLVFGPKKLPEMARKIGKTINEIKSVSNDITKEIREETRNITTEIKTARESARINSLAIDDPTRPREHMPVRKNVMEDKPTVKEDVTIDNNNIPPVQNVNGEKEIK